MINASIMAANMCKNSLKNVESDNNKILYETLLDFLQLNGTYCLNKPRINIRIWGWEEQGDVMDIGNGLRTGWSEVLMPVVILLLGIKQPGRGLKQFLLSSVQVKNIWRYGSPYMPSCLWQRKIYLMTVRRRGWGWVGCRKEINIWVWTWIWFKRFEREVE